MRIDLSPLYRSGVGFDRMASLLNATANEQNAGYPPYNIELIDEDEYRITMALAGFKQSELEIVSEQNTLMVRGKQQAEQGKQFLHQGIAARSFERKFQLADHVRVETASMEDGLLHVELKREVPEAMKPRSIEIKSNDNLIEEKDKAA